MTKQPDYIVIGAGSAGCVLANRLSGHDGGTVLLLEAGGPSRGLMHRLPLTATKLWFNPKTSWSLVSEPEPGLGGRRIPVPRGRALGGSSAINGTIFNRGSAHDYDAWGAAGLDGWDYASVLPYFRRLEDHWRGTGPLHGAGGAVPVTKLRQVSPITPYVLNAARDMGLALATESDEPEPDGIGLPELNVDSRGRRVSAADAFLWPIRGRKGLEIATGAQVLKLLVEQGRVVGVDYLRNGQKHTARAQRQIILSAGAIASPQLLLLSGIGPADDLAAAGIAVVHDLPGVGRGFNDQPGASFEFRSKLPQTFTRSLRADRFAIAMVQWALGFGGPAAGPPVVAMGALRTRQGRGSPDLRMMLAGGTMQSKLWFPGIGPQPDHRLLMNFAVAHPHSRGSITLASADPLAPPRILFNLLTDSGDMDQLRSFYRLLRELIRQPSMQAVAGDLIRPAPEPADDQALDAYLRSVTATTSHPMGSCRMGADAASVVDSQCRLRGLEGLRVADASVFPGQIAGNPHSAVMMLADRVADMALGRPLLAPATPQAASLQAA